MRTFRPAPRRTPPARSRLTVRRAVAALTTARVSLEAVDEGLGTMIVDVRAGRAIDPALPRRLVEHAESARSALAGADLY